MRPRNSRLSAAWVVVALMVSAAGTAGAQGSAGVATANEQFNKGLALLKAKNYVDAIAAFEQAQALDPGWGTLFNLAVCYRLSGRLASAWAAYRDVAQNDTDPQKRERRSEADKQAKALEKRLSRLLLTAIGSPPGLVVTLDRVDVTRLLGTAYPVDRGEHLLHASAPNYQDFDSTTTISGEGKTITVAIELPRKPPVADSSSPPAVAPIDEHPAPTDGSPTRSASGDNTPAPVVGATHGGPVDPEPAAHSRRATYGVIVAAGGGALIVTGLVFGGLASNNWNSAKDGCPELTCDDAAMRNAGLVSDARTQANISTAFVIGGAVAIGVGAVLFITAPSRNAPTTSTALRLTPSAGAGAVSLTLDGRF